MPNKGAVAEEKYQVILIDWHFKPYSGTYVQEGFKVKILALLEYLTRQGVNQTDGIYR